MIGEIFREVGVLVLVLFPLESVVAHDRLTMRDCRLPWLSPSRRCSSASVGNGARHMNTADLLWNNLPLLMVMAVLLPVGVWLKLSERRHK
jgi:hypothetical protein